MNVYASQANAAIFTNMKQDNTLALVNLATATQAARISAALQRKTILELSIQVATLTPKLATAQSENDRLKIVTSCYFIVRVNPTKRESQRAKLERYFLECVS